MVAQLAECLMGVSKRTSFQVYCILVCLHMQENVTLCNSGAFFQDERFVC